MAAKQYLVYFILAAMVIQSSQTSVEICQLRDIYLDTRGAVLVADIGAVSGMAGIGRGVELIRLKQTKSHRPIGFELEGTILDDVVAMTTFPNVNGTYIYYFTLTGQVVFYEIGKVSNMTRKNPESNPIPFLPEQFQSYR